KIVGERFLIYASKGGKWKDEVRRMKDEQLARRIWSDDLAITTPRRGEHPLPGCELAELLISGELPTGVIVGSAVIEKVTMGDQFYEWHLADVRRVRRR